MNSSAVSGSTTYKAYIARGITTHGGWKAGDDLDTLRSAGNTRPSGIWSDGTTMWIADSADAMLYAYTLASGAHDSSRDITLDSNNDVLAGLWSAGTTIWVVQSFLFQRDKKVFAYTLDDGSRDSSSDLRLVGGNANPYGIWSDRSTAWILDTVDDKIYAYTLANDAREQDKEIKLNLPGTSGPQGIWSDCATIWVVDRFNDQVYAHDLTTGNRTPGLDFRPTSSNANAYGIWANSDTAWVVNVDSADDSPFVRIYTYNNIPVTVNYGAATYSVDETDDTSTTEVNESQVTVKLTLSADP